MDRTNENKDDLKKPFSDFLVKPVEEIPPSADKSNDEAMNEPMPRQYQE